MSRVLASLFFLLSDAVSNPPKHTHTHRSTALQRHLAGLLHPWPCLPPSMAAKGGERRKKYKIEGLLQIWPWLWLGWGPAYNKSLISFTEGREWAAAHWKRSERSHNNQLSADFGAERYSLWLHFSHPVSTANHSQKCRGSTSPALNEQPVNFIHTITEQIFYKVIQCRIICFHKKKSLHYVSLAENYLQHARVIFCAKIEKTQQAWQLGWATQTYSCFMVFISLRCYKTAHPFVSALEIQFRRQHLLLGDVLWFVAPRFTFLSWQQLRR